MSNPVTMPMSFASITYAFFALQQDVPVSELEPIQFSINSANVNLTGGIGIPEGGEDNTYLQPDEEMGSAMPAGLPEGEAPDPFTATGMFVDSMPDSPVIAPEAEVEAIAAQQTSDFAATGMFGGDMPAGGQAAASDDDVPDALFLAKDPEPKKPVVDAPATPRASVQIGLLNELSFLDD